MARLYGRIVDATGWTFPQIDAMSVADVIALAEHWHDAPPMVECVRAYLGVKPAELDKVEIHDGPPKEVSEEEYRKIVEREKAYVAEQNGRRNPFL